MTLLAGIWGPGGVGADELRSRAAAYRFSPSGDPPNAVTDLFTDGPARFVLRFYPDSPDAPRIIEPSNGRRVVVLGFSQAELPPLEAPTAAFIDRLQAAEGEFVAAAFDPERREVQLISDRFGARPLYYIRLADTFVWSTHIAFLFSIIGRHPRFDPLGVLQMAQLSHALDGRTPYADVHRVRPATAWSLGPVGFTESRYWRLRHDVDEFLDPVAHAERAFSGMMKSVASRCVGRRGFVSLSGGLDSRLVAGCVTSDQFFAATRHVPGVNDDELEVARQVAERLGLRHVVERVRSADLLPSFERHLRLAGGATPVHHGIGLVETIDGMIQSGGFKLGGGPRDVLAGSYVPSLEYTNPRWCSRLVEQFAFERPRFNERELSLIFQKDLVAAHSSEVTNSLRASLAECEGPTAAHRVTAWAMVFRQPAFTFASPIAAHPQVAEASPHLGHAWTDAMLKLPATWLFRRNFYMALIYWQLPALREVLYANTGRLLPSELTRYAVPTRLRRRDRLRTLARRAVRHELATALMPGARRYLPIKGRGTFAAYALMSKHRALIASLRDLVATSPVSAIIDVEGARRYLDGVESGRLFSLMNGDHAALLGTLATICLAPQALRN